KMFATSTFSSGHWSFGGYFDNLLKSLHQPIPNWTLCRHHIFHALSKLQSTYIPALTKVTHTLVPICRAPLLPSGGYPVPAHEICAHFIYVAHFNAVCDTIGANFPVYGEDPNILSIVNRELPRIRALLLAIHRIIAAHSHSPNSHGAPTRSTHSVHSIGSNSSDNRKNEKKPTWKRRDC
ncbi:hypothetical protein PFISCL1PPCAC_7640, partial [Pristionchus fissidentatus]